MRHQPVRHDVHQRGAVLQRAQPVRCRERGAGVVRLVAQRAVQLGRVADGLVDRQPQVGGVDHEGVGAGLHRRRGDLLHQQVRELGKLAVPVPPRRAGPEDVLPAAAAGRCEGAHALERAAVRVDRDRADVALDPHPLLHRAGAAEVRVEHLLLHGVQRGGRVLDALVREQPGAACDEQRGTLVLRHVERVDVVRRHPAALVGRLRRQLDPPGGQRAAHLREGDGPRRQLRAAVGGEQVARGEAPAAVVDHSHADARGAVVDRSFAAGVVDGEVGRTRRHDPDVGVGGAERAGAREGGVGARVEGEGEEVRVDLAPTGHGTAPVGGWIART